MAIYDRSTHRKPNFVNPNEWVGLQKGDGHNSDEDESSDDEERVFRVWAEACKSDVGVRNRSSQSTVYNSQPNVHNSQSLTTAKKSSFQTVTARKPSVQNTKKAEDIAAANRRSKDYNPSKPGGKQASWRRMQEEMVKGVQTQVTKPKKKTKVQKKPAGSLEPVPVKRRLRNQAQVEEVTAH